MYDKIEYNEYNLREKDYIKELAEKLNLQIDEANFLMNCFLEKVHQEWVNEYANKYGLEKAKHYIEELEGLRLGIISSVYIKNNKYNEEIENLKIDFWDEYPIENEYTKKWKQAEKSKEIEQIVEESEEKINGVYKQMLNDVIERKPEFDEKLKEYIETKDNNRKKIQNDNMKESFAKIWFFIISIATMFCLINKDFTIISVIIDYIIFGTIAILEMKCFLNIYNKLKWAYFEKVFVIPLSILLLVLFM